MSSPVKQMVKRLPWISISCYENTVEESSSILFASQFEANIIVVGLVVSLA